MPPTHPEKHQRGPGSRMSKLKYYAPDLPRKISRGLGLMMGKSYAPDLPRKVSRGLGSRMSKCYALDSPRKLSIMRSRVEDG